MPTALIAGPYRLSLELLERRLASAVAAAVHVSDESLTLELSDGRIISAPIAWFPRLAHGTPAERNHLHLHGDYIHWPELDEDIPVRALLLGKGPGESAASLQRWLDERKSAERTLTTDLLYTRANAVAHTLREERESFSASEKEHNATPGETDSQSSNE